jgi:desampylase
MKLTVTRRALAAMRLAERMAFPREACGILLGERDTISEFVATDNVHPSPETHFEIDPQALINAHRAARDGGPLVLGYFHSHPSGEPRPSQIDREMAPGDGRVWAIAAGGRIEFWRDEPEGFSALSCEARRR